MKKTTLFFALLMVWSFSIKAQEACSSVSTFLFYTTNAGWTNSDYYKIIDIDAEMLTNTSLPAHSGDNGTNTSSNFGSGAFTTPVYTYNETSGEFEPTNIMWPVNYFYACIAPTFLNSASTKVQELGTNPSKGSPAECTNNNNTVLTSPIWDKRGFIELSRQGADAAAPEVSRHGYIEIDNLPQVERVQWSFSSTGYKRGVKLDINYNQGNGWEPLQWEASNLNNFATFAEQGYQFENMIYKENDTESKISLRWRIWDGDTIHVNPMTETPFTTAEFPYAQQQVVRIHQIKIFSGIIPDSAPNAVFNPTVNEIQYLIRNNNIEFADEYNVELYSIIGKQLINQKSKIVNVSNIEKGIYILRVTDDNGKSLTKKIKI